jgi:AraC-like DNA-binding protein
MRRSGCSTDKAEPIDLFHTIVNYIQANLSHPLRIAAIADMFHLSQPQLFRLFKRNEGVSPQRYYTRARMNYACTLIHQSLLSFKEISQLCGYEYESHFYKAFRKEFHITPAEFRDMR